MLLVFAKNKRRLILTDDELIEKIRVLLNEQESADRFSGTVLVARGGHPILTEARGYAIHPEVMRNQGYSPRQEHEGQISRWLSIA